MNTDMVGFELPPYPYDRLNGVRRHAAERFDTTIDLSIGMPIDPPPPAVVKALGSSNMERSYPPSIGTPEFRSAAAVWLAEQFGANVEAAHVGATIGSKEFVAGLPQWLHLRDPQSDTVLYPAVSYPSYAMGAELAGLRSVAVPIDDQGHLMLDAIRPDDIERALCLWVNSPGNPAGGVDDLVAIADWGRRHGVTVFSDECYIEFTWEGRGRSILEGGPDGVVAVHSLSKRSNLAGVRVGFYAGDAELVSWLQECRKHAGFMTPGPNQAAAIAALQDQDHVQVQRGRYWSRLNRMVDVLSTIGFDVSLPAGGFYLWLPAPDGDAWALVERFADELGVIVSPGEFYGSAGSDHVRLALVCTTANIEEIERRSLRLVR